ncbi:MAG: hypothetical protein ACPG9K_05915 [Poseidonibacter sp.]
MELFFKLEAGYLGIAAFALVITLIVTTRPFMPKGALKKGLLLMGSLSFTFIALHYYVTSSRIIEVETAFNNGKKVLCESRAVRKVAQSVSIEKSNEWSLKEHMFSSPNYSREFFSARCIKYVPITLTK